MTLTEFLLARIAEDEHEARDASADAMMGARWKGYPEAAYNELQSLSIANSRRVLAECEAKRRIIDAAWDDQVRIASEWGSGEGRRQMSEAGDNPPILECLAIPYADHPDYREEWRP